jgi:hypothetical protein
MKRVNGEGVENEKCKMATGESGGWEGSESKAIRVNQGDQTKLGDIG